VTASADADVVLAYSATGWRWRDGPGRVYDRLSEILVAAAPVGVRRARVLDVGAGAGAATRAAVADGARSVVAIDRAFGMLEAAAAEGPTAVLADARWLPLRAGAFDLAVAAFVLNHLAAPLPALEEIRRVLRPGGGLVVGTYAADDTHPVKGAVETVLLAAGWEEPGWYRQMRAETTGATSMMGRLRRLAEDAGLVEIRVRHLRVPFPELAAPDLVAWRLGMAQHAPFLAGLGASRQGALMEAALELLGETPVLVRSLLVLCARTASGEDAVDPAGQRAPVHPG